MYVEFVYGNTVDTRDIPPRISGGISHSSTLYPAPHELDSSNILTLKKEPHIRRVSPPSMENNMKYKRRTHLCPVRKLARQSLAQLRPSAFSVQPAVASFLRKLAPLRASLAAHPASSTSFPKSMMRNPRKSMMSFLRRLEILISCPR